MCLFLRSCASGLFVRCFSREFLRSIGLLVGEIELSSTKVSGAADMLIRSSLAWVRVNLYVRVSLKLNCGMEQSRASKQEPALLVSCRDRQETCSLEQQGHAYPADPCRQQRHRLELGRIQ